nr:NADH dehydrogenase subunit 5 [Tylorrhynchus heterochaetus]
MITWILSIMAMITILVTTLFCFNMSTLILEWNLLEIGSITMSLPIIMDPAGMMFLSTVLTIAASVMQFAKSYMAEEKFLERFTLMVLLFVLSMMFLILLPNLIILLLGWDGLGITSFVLVIYYQNNKSLGAGLITAFTNRIGDVMILISIALLLNTGHWNILSLHLTSSMDKWVVMLIMIAAMTKSAQMPFSSWLPAAMAAPTPVSALVHSSTLVTAGVFLLYRFYPFLNSYPMFNKTLTIIATLTMLMAGCSAMAECDMKKIIALSTLSQLGVMMFTLGIGLPKLAFFHLITHALFKALLFICAGFMIHYHHHSQDLRIMGSTCSQLPIIMTAMLVANIALCGAPFMAGFYSKDLIIESFNTSHFNYIIMMLFMTATILTTAYSTRFSIYTTLTFPNSLAAQYTSESNQETHATLILTSGACAAGAAINWLWVAPSPEPILSHMMKLTPIMMLSLGMLMGYMLCTSASRINQLTKYFNANMWFLTPMSTHSIIPLMYKIPLNQLKISDQGWNEAPQMIFNSNKNSTYLLTQTLNTTLTTQVMSGTLVLVLLMTFL